MKVVHVVRQYLPSIGGMEEVVRNLVQYQDMHTDYQPSIVTLNRVFREPEEILQGTEVIDGIAIRRLPYSGSERYPWCPQVLETIRESDLVHVHGIDFFFDFLAISRTLHRKRLIVSTHGGFFHTVYAQRLKQIFFHSVTRLSSMAYSRVIATSENDGEIFGRIMNDTRLKVIENGVDIQKFDDVASLALKPHLIYFGRWSVNKGLEETIDVLAALCLQQPEIPWQLTIAGREYDLTAQAILALASQKGIADRVHIVPGPSNQQLRALLGDASYFICMSRHEGFGIAPIEAMSAGLLPILSAIPPFENLVKSSGVGLVLKEKKVDDQARQIAQWHSVHCHDHEQGVDHRRAPRSAAQIYSWKGVAARYTEQYDQVTGVSS